MGNQTQPPLLLEMRRATRRAHNVANVLILSKLAVVLTDKQLYGHALASFHPVYQCLEELLQRHKDEAVLAPVVKVVAAIPRTAALEQDLKHLLGSGWQDAIHHAPPASAAYVQHLQQLAAQNPTLLLPYAFSLYVPILLGFMAARIQKALQLPGQDGLQFFSVPSKSEQLAALRAAVNEAGEHLEPQERKLVVEEAVEQFRLNNSVVAGFNVGYAATARAAAAAVSHAPLWLVVPLAAAAVAGTYALASAASSAL